MNPGAWADLARTVRFVREDYDRLRFARTSQTLAVGFNELKKNKSIIRDEEVIFGLVYIIQGIYDCGRTLGNYFNLLMKIDSSFSELAPDEAQTYFETMKAYAEDDTDIANFVEEFFKKNLNSKPKRKKAKPQSQQDLAIPSLNSTIKDFLLKNPKHKKKVELVLHAPHENLSDLLSKNLSLGKSSSSSVLGSSSGSVTATSTDLDNFFQAIKKIQELFSADHPAVAMSGPYTIDTVISWVKGAKAFVAQMRGNIDYSVGEASETYGKEQFEIFNVRYRSMIEELCKDVATFTEFIKDNGALQPLIPHLDMKN